MKTLTIFLMSFLSIALWSADFDTLKKEVADAKKAKDQALTLQKYKEFTAAAQTEQQKFAAYTGYAAYLISIKQRQQANAVIEAEIDKDTYGDTYKQLFIISYVAHNLWNGKMASKVNARLKQALKLNGLKPGQFNYFRLLNYVGCNFCYFTKEYQQAIDIILPHIPAFKYASHKNELYFRVGDAYDKLGKKEDAVKYYQLSVDYGKKAKRNTSSTEKRIKELSK